MIRALIFVVALVAGGLAAWLAMAVQANDPVPTSSQPVTVQERSIEVLVAAAEIAQGQTLSESNLRWQAWPEHAVQGAYVTRSAQPEAVEALRGLVVRTRMVAGEPILQEKLSRGAPGQLAAVLPSGKRAVGIRISAENTAGGFILPNDRVDVIQTVTTQSEGHSESISRTILANVRVLAIDQKAEEGKSGDGKEQGAVVGKTATLELEPAQSEVIAAAQASGLLSLALRSVADSAEVVTASKPDTGSVRILRAGRSEVVKLR